MMAGFAALDYITLIGFGSSRSRIVLRGNVAGDHSAFYACCSGGRPTGNRCQLPREVPIRMRPPMRAMLCR
jgi:hypothetical protein